MCQTAGMENYWIKFVAKFVSPEVFYFGGNINFNEFFFTGIFTYLSRKLCFPVTLKINSCLLNRLLHTGKVQTKTKTAKQNMRYVKGQTARVYFRISEVHSSLERSLKYI